MRHRLFSGRKVKVILFTSSVIHVNGFGFHENRDTLLSELKGDLTAFLGNPTGLGFYDSGR